MSSFTTPKKVNFKFDNRHLGSSRLILFTAVSHFFLTLCIEWQINAQCTMHNAIVQCINLGLISFIVAMMEY